MNDQIISRCPWGDVKDKAMQEYMTTNGASLI